VALLELLAAPAVAGIVAAELRLRAHDGLLRLAVLVLGAGRWELLNLAKTAGKCDPRMAIIALEAEVRAKGLTALAIERGLL
jgi:hypothetical protein